MDEADRAQLDIEKELEAQLTYRKPEPKLQPNGICHYCYEEIEDGKLFCNAACAKSHSLLERR